MPAFGELPSHSQGVQTLLSKNLCGAKLIINDRQSQLHYHSSFKSLLTSMIVPTVYPLPVIIPSGKPLTQMAACGWGLQKIKHMQQNQLQTQQGREFQELPPLGISHVPFSGPMPRHSSREAAVSLCVCFHFELTLPQSTAPCPLPWLLSSLNQFSAV